MENWNPKIYCLSPNSDLQEEQMPGLGVYFRHLLSAFGNSQIRNLAVTGEFGVGKSSVIRSFDKYLQSRDADTQCNRYNGTSDGDTNKPEFLYVSLGKFSDFTPGAMPEHDDGESAKKSEVNAIERRILMQIYARFRQKDIPLSNFKLIREDAENSSATWRASAMLIFLILLAVFHSPLTPLLEQISSSGYLTGIPVLASLLYLCVVALFSTLVGRLISQWIPKFQFNELSFKASMAEFTMEKSTASSYLDLYSMELVYCLERIADQIHRTVVFEDMDRLGADTCIYIFSRLREANHLINLRLSDASRPVRFIYAVNNEVIGKIQHTKFFDYTLSVIPRLNKKTSELILFEQLKNVHKSLAYSQDEDKYDAWTDYDTRLWGIVHETAPYLTDYRLQYAILNDYSLISGLYCQNNNGKATDNDAAHIFAFCIYKNVWPQDYHKIRDRKSEIFSVKLYSNIDAYDQTEWEPYGLLKILLEQNLLTARCLYYVGYSADEIAHFRAKTWRSAKNIRRIIRDFESIELGENESVTEMCNFLLAPEFQNLFEAPIVYSIKLEAFQAAILCVTRCEYKTSGEWFLKESASFQQATLRSMPDDIVEKFKYLTNIP